MLDSFAIHCPKLTNIADATPFPAPNGGLEMLPNENFEATMLHHQCTKDIPVDTFMAYVVANCIALKLSLSCLKLRQGVHITDIQSSSEGNKVAERSCCTLTAMENGMLFVV